MPITFKFMRRAISFFAFVSVLVLSSTLQSEETSQVLVRDITTIEGVRENPLIGYGIVVGLKRTGDSQQTQFTTQALANVLQRLGVQIPAAAIQVRNIAAVMVTASLPPFARPGTTVDVTVSSVGDAKSLEGGVLLLTSLHASNGQVYAEAQGPLTLGGYTISANGTSKEVNHVTVARVPGGAIVELDSSIDLSRMKTIAFTLRNADFTVSNEIANAINQKFGSGAATALDSRRIEVVVEKAGISPVSNLISEVQQLSVSVRPSAKVILNERTGTVVMGGDVKLSPVSVLHGDLTVEVTTNFSVSQPAPFSKEGKTVVVPESDVQAREAPARSIQLKAGASVEELINGLHTMGATSRDIIAILQAIKAAGGLQADLEVL